MQTAPEVTMQTLHDQFALSPEIFKGMDGSSVIAQNVESLKNGLAEIARAGDGVDYCIAAAMIDAKTYQDGRAGDVLAHLTYQRDQLSILIRNLSALPEMIGWTPEKEAEAAAQFAAATAR